MDKPEGGMVAWWARCELASGPQTLGLSRTLGVLQNLPGGDHLAAGGTYHPSVSHVPPGH